MLEGPGADLRTMSRRIFTALTVAAALGAGTLAAPASGLANTGAGTQAAGHHHRHALHRRQGPLAHIALR